MQAKIQKHQRQYIPTDISKFPGTRIGLYFCCYIVYHLLKKILMFCSTFLSSPFSTLVHTCQQICPKWQLPSIQQCLSQRMNSCSLFQTVKSRQELIHIARYNLLEFYTLRKKGIHFCIEMLYMNRCWCRLTSLKCLNDLSYFRQTNTSIANITTITYFIFKRYHVKILQTILFQTRPSIQQVLHKH